MYSPVYSLMYNQSAADVQPMYSPVYSPMYNQSAADVQPMYSPMWSHYRADMQLMHSRSVEDMQLV